MRMISIVTVCLLALGAFAQDKKLSSYATTLADNSANLAFRYPTSYLMNAFVIVFNLTTIIKLNFFTAFTTTWQRRKTQRT